MTDTPIIRIGPGVFKIGLVSGLLREMKQGDWFTPHVHPTEELNHITAILSGSVVCSGRPAIEGEILRAGDVVDWVVNEPHAMQALSDGTRVLQVRKGG